MIAWERVMIMAPCGMQLAGEVLGAEQEQHLTINNLLFFWPCVCVCICVFVCALFLCVFSWTPRRIMVILYGSSPQVKCLVPTGPVTVTPARCAGVSSFTVTHSRSGQMEPTVVAITVEQVLGVCVRIWWDFLCVHLCNLLGCITVSLWGFFGSQ